jgi:hypothetical protein
MILTHTFAHRETLSRAHTWLTQVGFHPLQLGAHTSGVPRLVLVDEPHRMAAAKMLINAAENADPDGFTSFWDKATESQSSPREYRMDIPAQRSEPHTSVLGWHPLD